MPLKHTTETTLVAVLGVAMILAGIVIAVLSLVTSPWLLWIAAFFISLAYPLILYPHFRERRADYEFRVLHFAPALFLLVWLVLTVLSGSVPFFGFLRGLVTFAWALPLVALGFLALAWFSVHVIRQWSKRIGVLALIFVPFVALAMFGQHMDWNMQLAALLETGTGSSVSSGGPIVAGSASSGIAIVGAGISSSSVSVVVSQPPHLPQAGGGIELFAMLVPAATCASVQIRAMRRNRV